MEQISVAFINFRTILSEHSLFAVGMLLIMGYLFGIIAKKIKLPEITGFIIAGLILGDSFLGVIHHEMSESFAVITDVALGLIAITIGGEFLIVKLKKMGKEIVIMTASQILLTFILVTLALYIFSFELPYALLMGAIATATAPAATVAVVQSLRAYGPFIDRLYGLVALDDAGCVIIFGVVFAVVSSIIGTAEAAEHTSSIIIIFEAFSEIIYSLILGVVVGVLVSITTKGKTHEGELLILTLGFTFMATSIAIVFHLSPLLTNMAAGTLIINLSPSNHRIFKALKPLSPPIYALFFALAGTEFNPAILFNKEVVIVGGIFIIARALGKYFGVRFGGVLGKTECNARKYLGFCMLPQAGVAIGLILMIKASPLVKSLPPDILPIIDLMVNIVLLSVFVNELIGPLFSKFAIKRALGIEED